MTVPFCLAEIFQNEGNEILKSVTKPPCLGGELMTHGLYQFYKNKHVKGN